MSTIFFIYFLKTEFCLSVFIPSIERHSDLHVQIQNNRNHRCRRYLMLRCAIFVWLVNCLLQQWSLSNSIVAEKKVFQFIASDSYTNVKFIIGIKECNIYVCIMLLYKPL